MSLSPGVEPTAENLARNHAAHKAIDSLPLDHFWAKCMDILPSDWCMQLSVRPWKGRMVAVAWAFLDDDEVPADVRPIISTNLSCCELKALENMFYKLRDGIVTPVEV